MVNTDDFIKRLEIILDFYSLSASGFADKIGVQRSSLSHLLSGRNKPSLDFILKIIEIFPEVDLYWILNGTGIFPKSDIKEIPEIKKIAIAPPLFFDPKTSDDLFSETQNVISEGNKNESENQNLENTNISKTQNFTNNRNIERIVIFYFDGTFSEYAPK
jgi:transcriptional regulator with XRE-family HTH domain